MQPSRRRRRPSTCLAVVLSLAVLAVLVAPVALADHHVEAEGESGAAAPADAAMASALMGMFDRTTDKLQRLADAMPASIYGWRPADEVYSVSEALMHVAEANFALANTLGVERPADLPEDMSAVTDKAEVAAWVETSVVAARGALEKASGEDMGAMVNAFGQEMSRAMVAMIILDHNAEHLGQLIAYGRSNGVVPPWSQAQDDSDGDGDGDGGDDDSADDDAADDDAADDGEMGDTDDGGEG